MKCQLLRPRFKRMSCTVDSYYGDNDKTTTTKQVVDREGKSRTKHLVCHEPLKNLFIRSDRDESSRIQKLKRAQGSLSSSAKLILLKERRKEKKKNRPTVK